MEAKEEELLDFIFANKMMKIVKEQSK